MTVPVLPAYLVNLGALVCFGIIWGLTIPLSKVAVGTGHHQFGLIFWQLAITTVVLGLFIFVVRFRVPLDRRHLRFYLVIAFIGTLIPNSFSYMAIRELPAGIMSVVIATVPIMSLTVALSAKIERFEWRRLIGILCGVAALVFLTLPDVALAKPLSLPWIAIALIAPFFYGIEGNYVAVRSPPACSAISTLFGASAIGMLLMLPVAWFGGYWVSLNREWTAAEWAILGSSLGHLCAYSGYIWLVRRAGAVFTSQGSYVVTLTGVFASMLFLGENYGWIMWLSVAMMLVAVSLVKPRKSATA